MIVYTDLGLVKVSIIGYLGFKQSENKFSAGTSTSRRPTVGNLCGVRHRIRRPSGGQEKPEGD